MSDLDLAEIKRLPVEERLALVEDIWDSIAQDAAQVGIPDWHREVLRERQAEYRGDAEVGGTWADVRKRIDPKA
jgi:putative addiction module component (TIGR02574 family)